MKRTARTKGTATMGMKTRMRRTLRCKVGVDEDGDENNDINCLA